MTAPTLVVFDEACDTADVLAAVYEPRGIAVERRRPSLEAQRTESWPSVVLMDGDRDAAASTGSSRVLIGRAFYSDDEAGPTSTHPEAARTLSPLFHFPDLIAAVDSLLAEQAAA